MTGGGGTPDKKWEDEFFEGIYIGPNLRVPSPSKTEKDSSKHDFSVASHATKSSKKGGCTKSTNDTPLDVSAQRQFWSVVRGKLKPRQRYVLREPVESKNTDLSFISNPTTVLKKDGSLGFDINDTIDESCDETESVNKKSNLSIDQPKQASMCKREPLILGLIICVGCIVLLTALFLYLMYFKASTTDVKNSLENLEKQILEKLEKIVELQQVYDAQINKTKIDKETLIELMQAHVVMFCAKLDKNIKTNWNHTNVLSYYILIFNRIEINAGGGYENTTGYFKTPKAGYYQFDVTLVPKSYKDTSIDIKIEHNLNNSIGSLKTMSTVGGIRSFESFGVHLKRNDKVFVGSTARIDSFSKESRMCANLLLSE